MQTLLGEPGENRLPIDHGFEHANTSSLTAADTENIIGWAYRGPTRRDALDAKLRRLLRDLRGAITEALTDPTGATRSMDEIREEGWSVYLVIDRKREDETPEGIELTGEDSNGEAPTFRINSRDLAFLKSVGIDPTRRVRRRR